MPTEQLQLQPPCALEAERALLGSIILDNRLRDEAMSLLSVDDFYQHSHRRIFAAIIALESAPIDYISIFEQLKSNNEAEATGGMSFLTNLTHGIPAMLSIKSYAKLITDKSTKRKVVKLAQAMAVTAMEDDGEARELLQWSQQSLEEIIGKTKLDDGGFRPFSEVADEAVAYYNRLNSGERIALPTGFDRLDKATRGGIHPGQLWVISALTGRGKSAWMIGAARQIAGRGYPVAIISREMSKLENFIRAHSAISGVPVWKIAPGLWETDYDKLINTAPEVAALPIHIDASTSDIFQIRSMARQQKRAGMEVLFVDYLQLLNAQNGNRITNRTQEVATVARVLKEIAMDLQIGVVALAQFNRNASNSDKPEMHQLADSSEIEKAADVTLILDMEEQLEGFAKRDCTMRIAKQRNGPHVSLRYEYDGNLLTFTEI